MYDWTEYNSHPVDQLKPRCPTCSNNELQLIDVVAASDGMTKPVWHCSTCQKVFAKREWQMQNIVSQHVHYQPDNFFDQHSEYGRSLSMFVDQKMMTLDATVRNLRDELEQLKIEQADPLIGLRKRVGKFELK